MGKELTVAELQQALPTKKNVITKEAVDILNQCINDPEFQGESLLQTASTYEGVLKGTRASVPEYLNAIRFCAYMTTNDSNYTEAYKKVFAGRDFVKERMHLPSDHPKYAELTSAASRYRRTKLVVDILTASQVPLDMIFTGQRYKAVGVLAQIMENGKYDRDKINAAKELLAATKGAENVKLDLGVSVATENAVEQLNRQLAEAAARQRDALEKGISTLEEIGSMKVKESDVIEGEIVQ